MQLFWISLGLLLSANLVHADQNGLHIMHGEHAIGLVSVPLDNIDGKRCSAAADWLADVPKEMHQICKMGETGFKKHDGYLKAVVRLSEHRGGKKNKDYICCVDIRSVCINGTGEVDGKIEVATETDEKGVWNIAHNCNAAPGKPNSCQDPKKNFCLKEAAEKADHYQRIENKDRLDKWLELPFCCPKHKIDKTCAHKESTYDGEEPDEGCDSYFGRCSSFDHTALCSKKEKDTTASSCCKPHGPDLCPFGIYPFGFKGKNGLVDWIVGNSGDAAPWKQACEDLAKKTEFAGAKIYISGDKCCAQPKLNEVEYYGGDYADLLTAEYERISTTSCENEKCGQGKFCGSLTSSYNDEPATGTACFDKIHCPHKSKTIYPVASIRSNEPWITSHPGFFTCEDSSTCPEDAICVWGKAAAATATKIKKSYGMCCSKAAYEAEMCTPEFLVPHNTAPGIIERSILTEENCQEETQKWGIIDTGAGGTGEDKTGVCCQYKELPPLPIMTTTEETASTESPETTRAKEIEDSTTDSSTNNNHSLQFHFFPLIFFLSLFR